MQAFLSAATVFLLALIHAQEALAFIECSVLDYGECIVIALESGNSLTLTPKGAVADNTTDLGPALTKAWQECVIPQVTTTVATDVLLYVPAGNYLLAYVENDIGPTSESYYFLIVDLR